MENSISLLSIPPIIRSNHTSKQPSILSKKPHAMTTQWAPAEVLQLDPNSSGFTCIGYAPSKGRRCRNPIACVNRQESAKILQEMSRLDPHSRRLDGKLEELASRLLCRRWHQDQAAGMKRQWQCDIENYRAATVRAERSRTVRTVPAPVHFTMVQTREISLRVDQTASLVAHLYIQVYSSLILLVAFGDESGGRGNNNPRPYSSSQQESLLQHTNHRENTSPPTPSADDFTSHTPDASFQGEVATTREEVTNEEESETHVLEAPALEQEPEDSPHAHERRAIEGDCSICFEDLSSGGDTLWCTAQCRQNFHADCINLWHASQEANRRVKTCPYW